MYTLIILAVLIFLPLPLMAASAKKTGNGYRAIFEGVNGIAMAMMLVFILAAATGNPVGSVIAGDLQLFADAAANSSQIVSMLGLEKLSYTERVNTLTSVYTYAINALPAVILVWGTIIAYFEYIIVSKAAVGSKYQLPQLGKFKDFSLPKRALWGWVMIYLLTFAVSLMNFMDTSVLQVNIQILFQFTFQIQGIAVIFHFCDFKKWPKAVPVILSIAFFPTAIGQMILCVMGFMDLGFGLRKAITRR